MLNLLALPPEVPQYIRADVLGLERDTVQIFEPPCRVLERRRARQQTAAV